MTNLQKFKHAFRELLKEYNTEIVIKEDNGIKVSIADEHECASINLQYTGRTLDGEEIRGLQTSG